jgi:[amino group carrier protein]-lysine/ornithine hydrolase
MTIPIDCPTLVGLVSQYSPSTQEQPAVNWLVARMKDLAYDEAFVDDTGNAVGVMGKGLKKVILLGHIDTVPGEIPVRIEEDILYGRGSVDAKGPLASFVDAVAHTGPLDGWQFIVMGAVEEEQESSGARYIASRYRPDYAIIGEPNRWDRVSLGYKGSARAEIIIKRAQTHSADGEPSAPEAAIETWLAVKTFTETINTGRQRAFDKLILNLIGIESGQDGFEQWVKIRIGVRLPIDFTPEDWYARLHEIIKFPAPFNVSIETIGYPVPAWTCEKNTRLVRALLTGIRSQGGTPAFVYKTGTADLNIVAPVWQCPTLVYGPGDSALDHTPNEHISMGEYRRAVSVLETGLRTLANF